MLIESEACRVVAPEIGEGLGGNAANGNMMALEGNVAGVNSALVQEIVESPCHVGSLAEAAGKVMRSWHKFSALGSTKRRASAFK